MRRPGRRRRRPPPCRRPRGRTPRCPGCRPTPQARPAPAPPRRRHRRQDLVLDRDQLGGVLRLVERLGDDERHRVADIADAVLRQERLRADKGRRAAPPPARHQRAQRAEPAPPQFVAGQDREHARRRPRRRGIECRRCGHAHAASARHSRALRAAASHRRHSGPCRAAGGNPPPAAPASRSIARSSSRLP